MAESQLCDMEVIYSPEPSDDAGYNDEVVRPALDIIIVGSMVDPTHQLPDSKSQAENQSRWFQDLLPEHISSARVMLFSRQSTATEDSAQDRTLLSAENLTQFAKALLERLTIERADDEYENVPITFVGYDLGGSIVKKALTLASESEEKADLAIFNNTCRLLFFGTPHRAHNIMSWVNLLFNIISSVPSPQPLKLNLHRRAIEISKELDSLSIAFSSIALRYSLINIYQVDVDAPMDWGDTIVDGFSSTTGFDHEINISRQKSYLDLGDFNQDIQTFSAIVKLLRIDTDSKRAECLSKLLSLSLVLVVPVEEQFAQLNIGSELDTWLQAPSLAAIQIQSESSVDGPISRILLRKLRENMLAVAYYSFNAQDRRRTSAIPILCSFIYQILNQDPEKFGTIRGLYHTLKQHSIWTQGALRAMFHALLSTEGLDTVFLVIDGIHEVDYDSHIKTLLEDLVHFSGADRLPTKIKIAIFGQESQILKELSRTFDRMRLSLGGPAWPRQQVTSLKGQAVARIIEARPYLQHFEEHLEKFLEQSEDPSQLALTVHDLLDETNRDLSTQASFQLKIKGVPTSTKDAVSSIYKTLPAWARRALGWVLHSRRPLQLNELSTAIGLFPSDGDTVVFNENDLFLDISTELEKAFGPLMKVNNGKVQLGNVQFGRYFAMALEEERQVSQDSSAESGAQEVVKAAILNDAQITLLLLRYLSSDTFTGEVRKVLRQDPRGKFTAPLFAMAEYAVQFWPAHYREAEKQGLHYESILPFLKKPGFVQTWSELHWIFDSTGFQPDFCITNVLDLAAQLGVVGVVEELQQDVKSQSRGHALALSSWAGHLDVVKILLDDKFDQSPCNLTAAVKYAAIAGYEEIVQLLLEHRVHAENVFSWDSEILCRAAEIGYETEVMLCLDNEAPVDALFENSTPLQLAARNGHAAIVHLLLSRGADKDSKQAGDSLKPILEAVKSGQALVLQHLLTFGASVTVHDEEECTPLHLAARYGQREMVKLLLDHCKGRSQEDISGDTTAPDVSIEQPEATSQSSSLREIDPLDKSSSSSLPPVSHSGDVEIVNLTLDEVAWVDLLDRDGHTALHIATKRGYDSIAEAILLYRDTATCFGDIDDVFLEAAKVGFMNILGRLVDSPAGHKASWKTLKDSTTGMTALHYAARNGYEGIVIFLVQTLNVEVDLEDKDGNTPLMLAAVASEIGIVRFLLENKADPQHTNSKSQTVLHLLSAKTDTTSSTIDQEIVKTFLKAKLSPNLKDEDNGSALHQAAKTGNFPIAESLIRGGAETMARNRILWTPLHTAARYGNDRICQLLIDHDVNTLETDDDGWTAMHVAAMWGRVGIMKILAKASPEALSKRSLDGRTVLHFAWDELESTEWLLKQKLDKDATDKSNETALFLAAQGGKSRVVEILLGHGADLKVANDRKQTALHVAAFYGKEDVAEVIGKKLSADAAKAKDECSKQLIADIVNAKDEDGHSPLQLAIQEDGIDCTIVLLQYPGIEINVRDRDGMTPLMLAVQKKLEKSSVEKLLDIIKKAKDHEENSTTKDGIHACDRQGRTVLHIAAAGQSWEVFQLLVDSGANKEARDIQGRTVFHHAAIKENNDLLDMLMCNDTLKDLNVRDRHGWSPLHWASRSQTGDTRTIELLLKGKNVIVERSQPSVHGWTPENIAIFHNASAISSFLQKPAKNTAEGLEAEDLVKTERQQGQKRWKVGQRHRWCECDGCGQQPLYGIRWNCQDCDDFDYCFKCIWTAEETHPDHKFEPLGTGPETSPEFDEDVDTDSGTDEDDDE